MNNDFCKRLKLLRMGNKKTQEEMAEVLNIKRSTYGEYERGKITPPVDKIELLAKILGTTPQYLLGWDEPKDEIDDTFMGGIIRKLREQKQISIEEFAKELGITKEDLKSYEDGSKTIPEQIIVMMAEFFGTTIDKLFSTTERKASGSTTVYFSTHKEKMERIRTWNDQFKDVIFSKEEVAKIQEYSKFLIFLRKENEK